MFGPRSKQSASRLPPRFAGEAPAPAGDGSLPEVPSIEGYTIDELRTEQLVHMIRLEELQPSQVAYLIRALTRGHG
jgi:hypothetical protein